jgi:hypothetical protein
MEEVRDLIWTFSLLNFDKDVGVCAKLRVQMNPWYLTIEKEVMLATNLTQAISDLRGTDGLEELGREREEGEAEVIGEIRELLEEMPSLRDLLKQGKIAKQ